MKLLSRLSCHSFASVSFVLAVLRPADTKAADTDATTLAAAKQLHQEAVVALDARRFDVACPKFEKVVQMIPEGYGARLSLGECYEGAGKLASAWRAYVLVEESSPKPEQRVRARTKSQALSPRLARLRVTATDDLLKLENLEVKFDSTLLSKAVVNNLFPVDRGEHTLLVRAAGHEPWTKILAPIDDGDEVNVEIPMLTKLAAAPKIQKTQNGWTQKTPSSAWSAQQWAGLAVGVTGLIGVAIGGIFGIQAIQLRNESNAGERCRPDDFCTQEGFDLRTKSIASGNWSTGLMLGGAGIAALGAILWISAPNSQHHVHVRGEAGIQRGHIEVHVSF